MQKLMLIILIMVRRRRPPAASARRLSSRVHELLKIKTESLAGLPTPLEVSTHYKGVLSLNRAIDGSDLTEVGGGVSAKSSKEMRRLRALPRLPLLRFSIPLLPWLRPT